MIDNDLDFIDSSDNIIAGIDEAGRGPLAGPVVAACVVLSRNSIIPGINDSKKISEKKRNSLYKLILKESISIGIGMVHEREIDKINILQSTIIAMQHSLSDASVKPDIVLIDGTNISLGCDREKCIIKGDQKSLSIASASIIAKVTRDRIMNEYDKIYPKFLFSKHKGYGTIYHRRIIKDLKPVIIHRLSFAPMKGVYRKSHIYELIFNNKIKYISTLLVKRGHLFVKIIGNKTNNGIVVSINNNNNIIFSYVNKNPKINENYIRIFNDNKMDILDYLIEKKTPNILRIDVILINLKDGNIDIDRNKNYKEIII